MNVNDLKALLQAKLDESKKNAPAAPDKVDELINEVKASNATSTSRAVSKPSELVRQEAIYGKGIAYGRLVRGAAIAAKVLKDFSTTGPIKAIHDVLRDKETAKWLEHGIEKDLQAGIPQQGGYLVPEVLADDLIELLRENTVVLKLGAREIPMPNGTLRIPRINTGTAATYVGETVPPNATSVTFGDVSFTAKKMVVVVPISNDMLIVPSVAADQIVRDDAVESMAVKFDYTALLSDGTSNTPKGIKFSPGHTDVNIGAAFDADNPAKFLLALMDAKVRISAGGKLGWAFSPEIWYDLYTLKSSSGDTHYFREELNRGKFMGYDYQISQQITKGGGVTDVFFGDWRELLVARQGMMQIDSSAEAAYNNSAGTVTAAYSNDQTVVRLIDRHDIGLRQAAAMTKSDDVAT